MEGMRLPPSCPFLLSTPHKPECMKTGCVMWSTKHSCAIKTSAVYLARMMTDLAEIKSMLKHGHAKVKVQHVHWWTRLRSRYRRRKARLRAEAQEE